MKKEKMWMTGMLVLILAIVLLPPLIMKNAEFGGTDDAGSQKIAEIDADYEPWAAPVLETALGGELPGEIETLFFCVQTGIGVGIIAFIMGRLVERKKYEKPEGQKV